MLEELLKLLLQQNLLRSLSICVLSVLQTVYIQVQYLLIR